MCSLALYEILKRLDEIILIMRHRDDFSKEDQILKAMVDKIRKAKQRIPHPEQKGE